MYVRNTITFIIILIISINVHSSDFVCMHDFDGDNKLTSEGEVASCIESVDGQLCPLDSTPCDQTHVCPLDSNTACKNGTCSKQHVCQSDFFSAYKCAFNSSWHSTEAECKAACVETVSCDVGPPVCPLVGGGSCLKQADSSYACSAHACNDLELIPPKITTIDDRMYVDDGKKDSNGQCLDKLMIYSGRTMQCHLPGKSTAWENCCKNFGEILTDSTGSISELALAGNVIFGAAQATQAAYTAYQSGQAISGASEAFKTAFLESVNPTTVVISLVVAEVLEYFMSNCSEMDMETGIHNASGRCYSVGEPFCTNEWFGECVQEAQAYCCFNSKMGRIIHEYGRPQLKSFSNVPLSDCRGFYPEEFQHIDFSGIDFSEYYGDLRRRNQSEVEVHLDETTTEFTNKINN